MSHVTTSNTPIKHAVLDRISQGKGWRSSGRSMYSINDVTVHLRHCSYRVHSLFNINPNTLRAAYEVWICGHKVDDHVYFLIPIETIRKMYDDPHAYPDRRHRKIRVVSVIAEKNEAVFASGGKALDIARYRGDVL